MLAAADPFRPPSATVPSYVLIIDDCEDDRDLYARFLKSDMRVEMVELAENGDQGVALYQNRPADCVLLDFNMPGQDGLAVLGRLKAIDPHVSVIIMTGEGNEDIAVAVMKAGALDYVVKEKMTAPALRRAVSNATERAALIRKIAAQRDEQVNFVRVLVHDIRAPLRGLNGFTEMLGEDLAAGAYAEVQDHLEMIRLSAKRLNALVDTLAHYALLDRHLAFETVDMQDVVGQVLDNLRPIIDERQAEVTAEMLPDVTGNGPELVQLLQNLIGNGIKYNQQSRPAIRVTAHEDDRNWVFVIEDNGIGLPPDKQALIFEPFQRLWGQDTYEGTGLGLAICRKIVERHDGRIWCESEPGKGSRFFFTMPRG